ncbi:hypothetical protein [Bombella favorum]|uniref:Uncharacterized protein n=1 Tax=Bombella favorum TaxID=2039164 RepID=A0ABR5ZPC9_9PROT|nr:hypothetical protein [Bombella favorum]MBA5726176.1 hypothetical protein [Bombella favorum]
MRELSFNELGAVSGAGLFGYRDGTGSSGSSNSSTGLFPVRASLGLADSLVGGIVDGVVGAAVGGLTGGANGGANGTGGVIGVGVIAEAVGVILGLAFGGLTGAMLGLSGGYVGTQGYRDGAVQSFLTGSLLPKGGGLF